MNQYGANILATVRSAEFDAEATASRRAAAVRERPADRTPSVAVRRFPAHRAATT